MSTTPNAQSGRRSSRPTTPLRRPGSRNNARKISEDDFPLSAQEPAFAELADSFEQLERNFEDLGTLNNSLVRFNENLAALLYGLNMNAFCVDFPEAPAVESYQRHAEKERELGPSQGPSQFEGARSEFGDTDTTFMTNDASFVLQPPQPPQQTATQSSSTAEAPSRRSRIPPPSRGGARGRARGSGIARGRGGASR